MLKLKGSLKSTTVQMKQVQVQRETELVMLGLWYASCKKFDCTHNSCSENVVACIINLYAPAFAADVRHRQCVH